MIQLTDFKKSIGLLLIFLKKRTIGRITLLNYWIFCGRHFFLLWDENQHQRTGYTMFTGGL